MGDRGGGGGGSVYRQWNADLDIAYIYTYIVTYMKIYTIAVYVCLCLRIVSTYRQHVMFRDGSS